MLSISTQVFLCHLSARLKVRMGERAGSLQELPHMIPPSIPVATTVPVSSIYCHSGNTTHQNTLNLYLNLNKYTSPRLSVQEWNFSPITYIINCPREKLLS